MPLGPFGREDVPDFVPLSERDTLPATDLQLRLVVRLKLFFKSIFLKKYTIYLVQKYKSRSITMALRTHAHNRNYVCRRYCVCNCWVKRIGFGARRAQTSDLNDPCVTFEDMSLLLWQHFVTVVAELLLLLFRSFLPWSYNCRNQLCLKPLRLHCNKHNNAFFPLGSHLSSSWLCCVREVSTSSIFTLKSNEVSVFVAISPPPFLFTEEKKTDARAHEVRKMMSPGKICTRGLVFFRSTLYVIGLLLRIYGASSVVARGYNWG